ncbi:hypothetical protein [Streptomyces sp. CO7]
MSTGELPAVSREVRLAAYPEAEVTLDHFAFPHTVVEGGTAALPGTFLGLQERRYSGTVLVRMS